MDNIKIHWNLSEDQKRCTVPLFSSRVTTSGKSQLADPSSLFKKRIWYLQNFTPGGAGEEQWNV
jgi:hypothetical protein